jgi:uncharacterized protein
LSKIKKHISDQTITIIVTSQLLTEIKMVTSREKLKKYFSKQSVTDLIDLLETIGENVETKPTHLISRDSKDNFLFDLIDFSNADFLVTGDKDLLEHNPFKTAKILTPTEFEKVIEKIGSGG